MPSNPTVSLRQPSLQRPHIGFTIRYGQLCGFAEARMATLEQWPIIQGRHLCACLRCDFAVGNSSRATKTDGSLSVGTYSTFLDWIFGTHETERAQELPRERDPLHRRGDAGFRHHCCLCWGTRRLYPRAETGRVAMDQRVGCTRTVACVGAGAMAPKLLGIASCKDYSASGGVCRDNTEQTLRISSFYYAIRPLKDNIVCRIMSLNRHHIQSAI